MAAAALFGAMQAQSYAPKEMRSRVPDAETGDYSAIHRIAIVSALGPEFRIQSSKAEEGLQVVDTAAWKIDELVARVLRKYLAGRFEVADAKIDGAGLRALPQSRRESRTLDFLKTQVGADVDAYLLVRPVGEPTPGPAGIGAHTGNGVALCANYEIDMIDARAWSVVGSAVSRMQMHAGAPAQFACYAEEAKPEKLRDAGTLDALRAQLQILIPRSLVETLRALDLGMTLPPPGAHSIAPPEAPADTAGIASVAVVSAIGDSFSFSTPYDLLHEKEVVETPISDWNLDAEVERVAAAALARKFAVKSASIDRAPLSRLVLHEGKRPTVEGLPQSAEVDAYVLIVKAFRDGTATSGAGLWNQDWVGRSTYAYVNYAVVLVDARTLKVLKASLPAMSPASSVAYPLMRVDGSLWPDGAKDHAAAAKARGTVDSLIADSIPETLYQMGLAPDAAEVTHNRDR